MNDIERVKRLAEWMGWSIEPFERYLGDGRYCGTDLRFVLKIDGSNDESQWEWGKFVEDWNPLEHIYDATMLEDEVKRRELEEEYGRNLVEEIIWNEKKKVTVFNIAHASPRSRCGAIEKLMEAEKKVEPQQPMKTVDRLRAAELLKAGWTKETLSHYGHWKCQPLEMWHFFHNQRKCAGMDGWLPAPDLDEVLEELPSTTSLHKVAVGYWCEAVLAKVEVCGEVHENPVEAAVDVWLRIHGKKKEKKAEVQSSNAADLSDETVCLGTTTCGGCDPACSANKS